ncbi:MAG: glycosyltransferase family 39 protein [Candidatus Methylomirabilis sp.]|nr:glycosyltransferase family 39 protein [Deltaproteobacteria bacterium]
MTDADQSPTRATHAPGASRLKVAAFLVLMLLAGGALRLWNIESKGPFIWDHAIYWLEGQWYATFAEAVGGSMERFAEERRTGQDLWKAPAEIQRIQDETADYYPWAGRPIHPLLIALLRLFFGERIYFGTLVAALAGVALIPAAFFFARRAYGEDPAKLAAAAAAFSGYSILYCIQGWTETLTALAFVPVMWFWHRSLREDEPNPTAMIAWSGFYFGFGIVVAIRLVPMVMILPALELFAWLRRRPFRLLDLPKRGVAFGLAMLVAPTVFEVPYHLYDMLEYMGRMIPAFPIQVPPADIPSYWLQAFAMVRYAMVEGGLPEGTLPKNLPAFPYFLARLDPVVALLGLAGTWVALRRRTAADWVLISWFWIPLLYLTLQMGRIRYLMLSMPALYILAGGLLRDQGGALWMRRGLPGPRRYVPVAAAVTALVAVVGTVERVRLEPTTEVCMADAVAFMEREGGSPKHITVAREVSQAYAGFRNVFPQVWPEVPPRDLEELRRLYDEGYRYYLVSFWRYTSRHWLRNAALGLDRERFEKVDRVVTEIENTVEPAYVCANPAGAAWPIIHEVEKVFAYAREFPEEERRRSGLIEVYDLKDFFEKRDAAAAPTAPEPEDAPSAP